MSADDQMTTTFAYKLRTILDCRICFKNSQADLDKNRESYQDIAQENPNLMTDCGKSWKYRYWFQPNLDFVMNDRESYQI